jgi:hypothetical protein
MDFTSYGWDRGDSSGEGLSRIAAAELHPLGYYGSGDGPIIQNWLRSGQQNFVNGSEGTDTDAVSYGCAILFLNYLHYQKGYTFAQIVQAGGSNLAARLELLGGEPVATSFKTFQALLSAHVKNPATFSPPKDNIFPLLEHPGVGFLVTPQTLTPIREAGPHKHVTLKPGPICPEKVYTYAIDDLPTKMTVKAVTHGFAHADFKWTLGGVLLPVHGSNAAINVNVRITDTTPGKDAALTESVPVNYLILDSYTNSDNNSSTLQFLNTTFPGNGDIDINVVAVETQAASIQASLTENWPYQTQNFVMDAPWASDVKVCNPRFVDMSVLIQMIGERIFILKTLPDPQPEQLIALAADLEKYRQLLQHLSGGSTGLRSAVSAVAGSVRAAIDSRTGVELPGVAGGKVTRTRNLPPPNKIAPPDSQPLR